MNKNKKDLNFVQNYLFDLSNLIKPNSDIINKLIKIKNIFLNTSKKRGKILIFGNGGSAAIASHVSVDLTKNAKIRTVNFNESDLITCFSNDYGYERWVEKAVDFYADKNDTLVLISSSGKSLNMINACKAAKRKKIKVISLTGHLKNNPLSKITDHSLWIDSKAYNFIENTHQIWLLTVCDLIIGKREYPAKKKD
ncbi:SIS domain-containing protein [Pelagibacteraceae bacterium]|jgi:D-sedoheptulose 7-phosphate isomerase|nr:SIS domain-containing protein [Pelagibacteraceae bacterium]|tara:strand:- start:24099 stop:24686 length:588 start_codon:yes stop_codon:yes gene_type:complete